MPSQYIEDSAGAIWYAVTADTTSRLATATFYSDIRCLPESVGIPADGTLLPITAATIEGGGSSLAPFVSSFSANDTIVGETCVVLITGLNFDPSTTVETNLTVVSVTTDSPTQMTVEVVGTVEGVEPLTVKNGTTNHFGADIHLVTLPPQILVTIVPGVDDWAGVSAGVVTGAGFLEKETNINGWETQAYFGVIPAGAEGWLEFTYAGQVTIGGGPNPYAMFGMSNDPTVGLHYTTLNTCFYCGTTNTTPYELGFNKGGSVPLAVGAVMRITRTLEGDFIYSIDGVEIIRTSTGNTGELHFDCSVSQNIKITDISLNYYE